MKEDKDISARDHIEVIFMLVPNSLYRRYISILFMLRSSNNLSLLSLGGACINFIHT